MQIDTEDISPDKANEWLESCNKKNRPIKMRHADRLASDMREKRWRKDGMPFRFDVDGNLLDGQHRLIAIVKSGITLKDQVIIRKLPRESFTSMDTGSKRSTADMLSIKSESNATTLSSALGVIVEYLKDGTIGVKGGDCPTTQELLDALDASPGLRTSVRVIASNNGLARSRRGSSKALMPPGLLSALHFLFSEKNSELADAFALGMVVGYNNESNPSFHLLRERLAGNAVSSAKLNREYIAAISIKAWNAERSKNPIRSLRYNDGEDFPTIR